MTHARQQIATKECTRATEGKQVDIIKTRPGHVEKARCVVVCCDTMRFASCEALAMVNKNTAVQMDGFWRVCRTGWRPVWHGWKWGCNAGGWGSKSHFEATRGVTNAMEVCQSSAMGVVLAKAVNFNVHSVPTSWGRQTLESALQLGFLDVRAACRAVGSPPPTCHCA